MELESFRRGSRAEYLARFVLSRVGFIAPVSREEDRFGIDLFLHISREVQKKSRQFQVPTGLCLALQIKSWKEKTLAFKDDKLRCLFEYQNPYFIVTVDVGGGRFAVYDTHQRIAHSYYKANVKKVTLRFKPQPKNFPNQERKSHQYYYVGNPIVSMRLSDFDGQRSDYMVNRFRDVLTSWCAIDAFNWSQRNLGRPLVCSPKRTPKVNEPVSLAEADLKFTVFRPATAQL
jgi:hypothetical protein